jgi:hypothetical protein
MTEHTAQEGSIFDWFGQQKWLHYLLSYLVAAWSLTEFLDWLVQRFLLFLVDVARSSIADFEPIGQEPFFQKN